MSQNLSGWMARAWEKVPITGTSYSASDSSKLRTVKACIGKTVLTFSIHNIKLTQIPYSLGSFSVTISRKSSRLFPRTVHATFSLGRE